MIKISQNFTLEELCNSAVAKSRGIQNQPNTEQVINLCALVHNVLQPLRDHVQEPVVISSGFRNLQVNKLVCGVYNSQHINGQAADISFGTNIAKCTQWLKWIMDNCQFDQLILEKSKSGTYWIHVSYVVNRKNRCQVIRRE